jgi:nucleoside-diphosphate-sugar epimerase
MQLLITGASGFIGTNLIPYLRNRFKDVVIKTLGRNDADYLWADLKETDLAGIDAVIHLAGKAHDTQHTSAAAAYFEANFELTKKLYDLSKAAGVPRFMYVSSVKAAADSVEGVLKEDHVADPKTPYGQSKLMAEQYITTHCVSTSARCYVLRPCMVHGPGNKGNLNLLYQFAKRGVPYPLAAFDNRRSFLSIANFCFVVGELLTRDIPSGIYNLADDEPLPTTELIKLMAEVEQRKASLWRPSPSLIRLLARGGDLVKLPLNSERLKKLTESYVVSNDKIRKALGVERMPVSAREGLRQTIQSFR